MKENLRNGFFPDRLEKATFFNRLESVLPDLVCKPTENYYPRSELDKATYFEERKQPNLGAFELRALDENQKSIVIISHTGLPVNNPHLLGSYTATAVESSGIRAAWMGVELDNQKKFTSADVSVVSEEVSEGIIVNDTDNTVKAIRVREGAIQTNIVKLSAKNRSGLITFPKAGKDPWHIECVDLSIPNLISVSYFDPSCSYLTKVAVPRRLTYGNGKIKNVGFDLERLLSSPPVAPFYPKHPQLYRR